MHRIFQELQVLTLVLVTRQILLTSIKQKAKRICWFKMYLKVTRER